MCEDQRRAAIERYLRSKELLILAEETDPEFNDFLQPYFEIARGFDHIARVEAARLGLNNADIADSSYVEENLRKATGHFYRAAFDILDWLSINLRESIIKEFEGFSADAIIAVMPEYYREIRPLLEEITGQIAAIRSKKDIGREEIMGLVDKYEAQVLDLRRAFTSMASKKPSLVDYARKEKRRQKELARSSWIQKIVIGLGMLIIGWFLRKWFGN